MTRQPGTSSTAVKADSLNERHDMASFNKVVIAGNLTRDPELKYLQSGTAVCDIGLAVNDKRKNQAGEWVDDVSFIDVTFFGRSAEVLGEYTRKGSNILVEGRLKQESWEKDGQKRSKVKVIAERMVMLGSKPQGGDERREQPSSRPPQQQPPPQQTHTPPPDADDSIPF